MSGARSDPDAPGRRRSGPGFTIIELAVVLAIIAIIGTLAITLYGRMVNKARFTEAQTALKHLQKTQTIWFTDHDRYTDNIANLNFDPIKYKYYVVDNIVILDNGYNFRAYARGIGGMAGDLWSVDRDGFAVHETPNF